MSMLKSPIKNMTHEELMLQWWIYVMYDENDFVKMIERDQG
jgi:hypothetical protein